MAWNRGRGARLTTAAYSYFGDKHGNLVYKEVYGAKIIFENRKSSRLPVKFACIVRKLVSSTIFRHCLFWYYFQSAAFIWHKTAMYSICQKIWARHANMSNKNSAVKSVIKRLECKSHGMWCPWFLAVKTSWCLNSVNYFEVIYCRWLFAHSKQCLPLQRKTKPLCQCFVNSGFPCKINFAKNRTNFLLEDKSSAPDFFR